MTLPIALALAMPFALASSTCSTPVVDDLPVIAVSREAISADGRVVARLQPDGSVPAAQLRGYLVTELYEAMVASAETSKRAGRAGTAPRFDCRYALRVDRDVPYGTLTLALYTRGQAQYSAPLLEVAGPHGPAGIAVYLPTLDRTRRIADPRPHRVDRRHRLPAEQWRPPGGARGRQRAATLHPLSTPGTGMPWRDSPTLETCALGRVRRIRFPAVPEGGTVTVAWPILFDPPAS